MGMIRILLMAAGLAGVVGCDRIRVEDRGFFEELELERSQREVTLRRANENVTTGDVIERVKQTVVDDKGGTTEQWLMAEIAKMGGQMLFPRWEAIRRGSNKQEVTFSFVLINDRNQMQRMAYSWQVDVLDMTVESPILTKLAEVASLDQTRNQQALRRVRDHEKQLE
jgi:hypothetical protein